LITVITAWLAGAANAEDQRQLAPLPAAAQESLRLEMLDNLLAINGVLELMAAGKTKEAGQLAETTLGKSAMGKNREKPFDARPGPHMPPAMHKIGTEGHQSASEFAKAASAGDRDQALALLPKLTGTCVACHYSYRTR
jgi:hypothetical protein